MKLAAKMVLSCVLVISLALGLTGYILVGSSFRSELNSRIDAAIEESERFCVTLGALALSQLDATTSASAAVQRALSSSAAFQTQAYFIATEDSSIAFRSQLDSKDTLDTHLLDSDELCYKIHEQMDADGSTRYLITTLDSFSLEDTRFFVTLQQDLGDVFSLRDQNLRLFRLCVLITIGVSALLIGLIAMFVTRPLQRLSRSTKQIAGGLYNRRAIVRSHDEFGEFAQDFNHMADILEAKIEELADAAQRQRDFTASFAHELKTPLTSVIGYADTLRSRSLPPDKQWQAANYIFTEGKRLEAMSRSLLDLFALENKSPVLRPTPTEQLAQAVSQSIQATLQEKKLHLHVHVSKATVLAEPALIVTLLYNLIDNARKASEPGSEILLQGRKEGGGYRFTVLDHGRGIPAEALSRITEPFFMVDKSRARSEGGAGLGLALCQRIALAHETQLEYQSEVGRGTSVSFILKGDVS